MNKRVKEEDTKFNPFVYITKQCSLEMAKHFQQQPPKAHCQAFFQTLALNMF